VSSDCLDGVHTGELQKMPCEADALAGKMVEVGSARQAVAIGT
jgi:hypothetical protein